MRPATTHPNRPGHVGKVQYRALLPNATSHFLNDVYTNVFPVVIPFLMDRLHLSVTMAGAAGALINLTSLAQPTFGLLADRLGGSRQVAIALALGGLAMAAMAFVPSYLSLIALVVLSGLLSAAYHPPALALTRELSGTQKGRGMSIFMIFGNVGRAAAPVLAGVALTTNPNWMLPMALPGLLLAFWFWRDRGSHTAARRAEKIAIWPLVRQRFWPLIALLLITGTRAGVTFSVASLVPILYKQTGSLMQGATFVAVMLLMASVGSGLGGTLSDRVPRHLVLAVSAVLTALFFLAFLNTHGLLSLLFVGLAGLVASAYVAPTAVMGQELFSESVALASGLVIGWGFALGGAMVAGLSWLADHTSVYLALNVAALLALVSLPASLIFPTLERRYHSRGYAA